jgi:hypothetical protein
MVCNTQNYWVYGICLPFGFVNSTKKAPCLRVALSKGPNRVPSSPHIRGGKQNQFPERCVL